MATNLPPLANRGDVLEHLSAAPQTLPFSRVENYVLFHARSGPGDNALDYFGIFMPSNSCLLVDQNGGVLYSDRSSLQGSAWVFVRYLDIGESLTIFGSAPSTRNLEEPDEVAAPMPNILKFGPENRNEIDTIPDGVPYWVLPQAGRTAPERVLLVNGSGPSGVGNRRAYLGQTGSPSSLENFSLQHRTKHFWTFERYADPNEIPNNIQNRVTDFGLRHSSTAGPDGAEVALPVGEAPASAAPVAAPAAVVERIRPPSNARALGEILDGVPFLASRRSGTRGDSTTSTRQCVIYTSHTGRRRIVWRDVRNADIGERSLASIAERLWSFARYIARGETITLPVSAHATRYFNDPIPAQQAQVELEGGAGLSPVSPPVGNRLAPVNVVTPTPQNIDLIPDGVPYMLSFEGTQHQAVNITNASGRRVKILKRYVRGEGHYLGVQTLSSRVRRHWLFIRFLAEEETNALIRELSTHVATATQTARPVPTDLTNLESIPEGVPFIVLWGFDRAPTQVVKRNGVLYNQDVNHLTRLTCSEQTLGNRTRGNWVFERYMGFGERIADALIPHIIANHA